MSIELIVTCYLFLHFEFGVAEQVYRNHIRKLGGKKSCRTFFFFTQTTPTVQMYQSWTILGASSKILSLLTDEFNESVLEKVNKLDDEDKNFTIYKKF